MFACGFAIILVYLYLQIKGLSMTGLQYIIDLKKEVLNRETYSQSHYKL